MDPYPEDKKEDKKKDKKEDYSSYLKAGLEGLGSAVGEIVKGAKGPPPPPPPETPKSGGFWTDPLVGPVPGWGVVAGGVGVGAVLWFVLRGR